MTGKTARICIGQITTVHGVRGLVKVRCFGEDPASLESYGPLYTGETGDDTLGLTLKHEAGGALIAAIDGVTDRNTAEKFRGTLLWIDRDSLPELDDGRFYHTDLEGLNVIDDAGTPIGTVIAVQNFGASDLLEIKPITGKTFYLPFMDDYVGAVDFDARTVIVDIPDGLRE